MSQQFPARSLGEGQLNKCLSCRAPACVRFQLRIFESRASPKESSQYFILRSAAVGRREPLKAAEQGSKSANVFWEESNGSPLGDEGNHPYEGW